MTASLLLSGSSVGSAEARPIVLVELFTSEGCSSCPPAERLLPTLDALTTGIDVIALAFHVDYWNYLGWEDRFASPLYSHRQRDYAKTVRTNVFTPQLIVDGTKSVIGSDRRGAVALIEAAASTRKASLTLRARSASDGRVALDITGDAPDQRSELFVAIAEDGLGSDVTRGENAGRRLPQEAVVRQLILLGNVESGHTVKHSFTVKLDSEWNPERLRYVVWVQSSESRRVLAAAELLAS